MVALEEVSLEIPTGSVFGIIGRSGAGKSTLIRCLNLLERPTSGRIQVDGRELTTLSDRELRLQRQNIGMIFQQFNLMANRTVAQNVAFALEVAGWQNADIAPRVMECLEIVDLANRAHHYPAQLSGGQKQRAGIARALAPRPHVMLADEPTSALDPATTKSVLACLKDINQKFNVTIVIVTHEMSVIRKLCHRVALLDKGQLLEVANVENGAIHAATPIGQLLINDDYCLTIF